jgi:FAD/FMN-containing dehydrogenase
MLTENTSAAGQAKIESVNELRPRFKGRLLINGDAGYDNARKIWNGMIDRRPALICQCIGNEDIRQAVKIAQDNNMPLSIRGGGHNVAGNALCENGVMIDLSLMRGIKVDERNNLARAEAGVSWGELDQKTLQNGLATTGGTVSSTGIAGLTLGGGLGWLMAKHGFTCDNLLSVEMVLFNGEVITADENSHTDLFWALRGGGGNFGVISSFTYRLHPMPSNIIGGMILYPLDQAKEVLQFYRECSDHSCEDLSVFAGLFSLPDGLPVVAIIAGWFGDAHEGERQLEPLRKFGRPLADMIESMPYTRLQTLFDSACPFGMRRYWKSGFLPRLDDALLEIIIKHATAKTSPHTFVLLFHVHGKATRKNPEATAFAARKKQWDFDIISQWTAAEEDDRHIDWARNFWREVEPYSQGVYMNHLDRDDGSNRAQEAFGINFKRLQAIRKRYDPDNLLIKFSSAL